MLVNSKMAGSIMTESSPISDKDSARAVLRLGVCGLIAGIAVGSTISVFRIAADHCYGWMRTWAADHAAAVILPIFGIAVVSALIVQRLMVNPAIRWGGAPWVREALEKPQPRVWRTVFLPKFLGSFLVKACGVSVGMEGPSIQMGCATALGLRRWVAQDALERRHFILGGCACGLAAAFSAPFGGISYVYEIMHEKFDQRFFIFLFAGAIGVFIACIQVFHLGCAVPIHKAPLPDLSHCWVFAPLILTASLVGLAYAWLLHFSARMYAIQRLIPQRWCPLLVFLVSAAMLFIAPYLTGEGPEIFQDLGSATINFLVFYIVAKLILTAFCYGSAVPCGVMVPLLTLGGISGALYAMILHQYGLVNADFAGTCIVLGMGAAFGAGERAPLTALLLVIGMTGAWDAGVGILAAAAMGAYLAKLVNSRPI